MRIFKPTYNEWEKCLPKKERARRKKRRRKLTKAEKEEKAAKAADRYNRKKLVHSGLWKESNNRSTLVVTRIEKGQSQLETREEKQAKA